MKFNTSWLSPLMGLAGIMEQIIIQMEHNMLKNPSEGSFLFLDGCGHHVIIQKTEEKMNNTPPQKHLYM